MDKLTSKEKLLIFTEKGYQVFRKSAPLTYYLEILRGILLKGNSITFLWSQILALIVFISATFIISIKKFNKSLD